MLAYIDEGHFEAGILRDSTLADPKWNSFSVQHRIDYLKLIDNLRNMNDFCLKHPNFTREIVSILPFQILNYPVELRSTGIRMQHSAFGLAIYRKNIALLQQMIDKGVDFETFYQEIYVYDVRLNRSIIHRVNAFIHCIFMGHLGVAQFLISLGCNFECCDDFGRSAYEYALEVEEVYGFATGEQKISDLILKEKMKRNHFLMREKRNNIFF